MPGISYLGDGAVAVFRPAQHNLVRQLNNRWRTWMSGRCRSMIRDGVIGTKLKVKSVFYNFLSLCFSLRLFLRLSLSLSLLLALTTPAASQANWQVYVFIGEDCPICNYMGRPLAEIARRYEGKADFHAVFPVKRSNYKTAQLFKEQYEMMMYETHLDKDLALTRQLGATITPEVVITDREGQVYYRGRINSAYYAPGKMKHSSIRHDLDEALAALTSGESVVKPWPSAVGCYITMTTQN